MLGRTLNLGILAHVDAGKTTLTERLLYAAGVIDELGSVDRGTTQTDTLALERQRGIRRSADAGVEDHRHAGTLDQDRDVVRIADPHPAANRGAERHHGGAADILEPAAQDRIVGGVGEHDESLIDEGLGGRDQLDGVRQQSPVVSDHLELDPIGLKRLPGQLCSDDGVAGCDRNSRKRLVISRSGHLQSRSSLQRS